MKLTKREEFLWTMYNYVKNGSDGYLPDEDTYAYDDSIKGRQELSHEETMNILNTKEKFLDIDVVHEELGYFGLSVDDFEWERKELTVGELINVLEEYPKNVKILIEDSDGSTSDFLYIDDIKGWWERDVQVNGLSTGENESVMIITKK